MSKLTSKHAPGKATSSRKGAPAKPVAGKPSRKPSAARPNLEKPGALAAAGGATRVEKDTMGEMSVPADVLYGA